MTVSVNKNIKLNKLGLAKNIFLAGSLLLIYTINGHAQKKRSAKKEARSVAKTDSILRVKKYILMGKYFGSSVVLRWAPKTAGSWEKGNVTGYQIYRFEFDQKNKELLSQPFALTPTAIHPLTLEQWKESYKSDDTAAAVAAELLYGKKMETTGKRQEHFSWEDLFTQHADMDNRLGLALFNADLHPEVAQGMGWRCEDKNIEKNKTYYYILISSALKDQPADTVSLLVSTRKIYRSPEMPPVIAMPWDRTITLFWNRATSTRLFTAYYVERSDDDGKTYRRLNNLPYISSLDGNRNNDWMKYADSIPRNGRSYLYRIEGVTAFGEISLPSTPVAAAGLDKKAPAAPLLVKAENTRGTQVKISWKKSESAKDFAGYLVGRSNNANGPFVPLDTMLIPTTGESFTDRYAVPWDKNFYIVAALDSAGNASRSMPAYAVMMDSLPPSAPTGLAGIIDSSGKVHLHWQWNREADLEGYNVYASNDPEHAFYTVNKAHIADSSFTDSIALKTLTRHIYYRICAFDKTGNPSAYSQILKLAKPDIVPPVAPVFNHFVITDSSAFFSWVQSSSEDVFRQIVWRKEKKDTIWKRLDSLYRDSAAYVDHHVQRLKEYDYCITAIDSAGLSSDRSFPLHARIYDSGKRKAVDELKATINTDQSIQLAWKYNQPDRQHLHFILYRNYNNNGLEMYKNISGSDNEFRDALLPGAGRYQYALKVVTDDGGTSVLVSSTFVQYEKKSGSQ